MDLPFIWASIIAFAVLAYVILDGFDLGVAILFPTVPQGRGLRSQMMNSVAPVWDGNETWLVLGGGGLFAAFPLAYAVVMPAIYLPLIAMLLGLVFRGVAFEYRWRVAEHNRRWWDRAFFGGSVVAAFCQGLALGTLVHGIPVENRSYAGGSLDWLTPFSVLCGFAVVSGYALLGATWLIMKTEGWLQRRMQEWAWKTSFSTIGLILVVSLWTPFVNLQYVERWFGWPQAVYSAIVPLLILAAVTSLFVGLESRSDSRPFFSSLAIFVLGFAGIGISFYPNIVPPELTIWDAAGPDASLAFLLVGASVLIPIILVYTVYSYRVFYGKVDAAGGYH
jgi:cytochrome bd ubiquinol oxidase subunit II